MYNDKTKREVVLGVFSYRTVIPKYTYRQQKIDITSEVIIINYTWSLDLSMVLRPKKTYFTKSFGYMAPIPTGGTTNCLLL